MREITAQSGPGWAVLIDKSGARDFFVDGNTGNNELKFT